jgi:hypothetical protein
MAIRIRSVGEPFETADPEAIRDALEAIVLADAMGLLSGQAVLEHLDLASVRRVARAASDAGIATIPAVALGSGRLTSQALRSALLGLREALEESPAPAREWPALIGVFGVDELARLVSVSAASLRRYASGARSTPDAVAARLHFLARVVADLKGAYNDVGVRRWFGRKRSLLRGRYPAQLLQGEWDPEDSGPLKVLELARSLRFSPAT